MPSSDRNRSSSTWDLNARTTLPRLLAANARALPQGVAFREKDRGIWQETTWQLAYDKTLRCAAGLQALGLQKGQTVLVLGDNRPHLYLGMLAVGMLGGFATPVYPDATPEEILHVVNSVHVQFVLAEDQEQVDKALDLRERGAPLQHIVYDNPRGLSKYTAPGLVSWDALQGVGAARLEEAADLGQRLTELAQPDDPAVLIHSSGTTGKPKGVALSHFNVLSGVANAFKAESCVFWV
jgi:long-chain acyl-CoA synthetase